MGIPKPLVLLCCSYLVHASHDAHSHNIPVEGYNAELQNLGQHVDLHETPVKVIKITKTIAVKIPVPYPVKVIQKVPYAVHVSKPYPVPVPQIVKIPVPVPTLHGHEQNAHEALDAGQSGTNFHRNQNTYQVQENQYGEKSYNPSSNHQAYTAAGGEQNFDSILHGNENSLDNHYNAPYQYGHGQGVGSEESDSYDQALNGYFANQAHGNQAGHY